MRVGSRLWARYRVASVRSLWESDTAICVMFSTQCRRYMYRSVQANLTDLRFEIVCEKGWFYIAVSFRLRISSAPMSEEDSELAGLRLSAATVRTRRDAVVCDGCQIELPQGLHVLNG